MNLQKSIQKNNELLQRTAALKVEKQPAKSDAGSINVQKNSGTVSEQDLFKITFENAQVGIAHVGLDGKWIRVNKRFCDIVGWREKELLSKNFLDIVHPGDQLRDLELVEKIIKNPGSSATLEKRYIRKDGSFRWVRASGSLVRDASGNPLYGIAVIVDIHEETLLMKNLELLAKAGKVLGGSLEYKETLSSVANLCVPQISDICIVDMLNQDGTYDRVKVAYADPKNKENVDILYQCAPTPYSKSLVEQSISSGRPILIREVNKKKEEEYARSKKHLKTIRNIDIKSIMVVPMRARGRNIGAISFFSTDLYRRYSVVDLALAEQIVSRAALAVDNALLYNSVQRAVNIRDTFLSITSHELKTSLTTIKAFAQLLQRDLVKRNMSDMHIEFLQKIDSQLNKSTKLINDLFDISKIQSGKILVKKDWIDVDAVVCEAVDFCRQLSSFHNIKVVGSTAKKIIADKDRINQVVTNLIANAIKYAPDEKDIIVSLSSTKKEISIAVKDYGIGIEDGRKKKIFERFYRAMGTTREKAGGLGLGLFIANELVKQHGGSINVESEVGKGAKFTVKLPVKSGDLVSDSH